LKEKAIIALIELSESIESANKIIEEYTGHLTYKEKLKYIYENFTARVVTGDGNIEDDYRAILSTIINMKGNRLL
jgi:hypothetical protein